MYDFCFVFNSAEDFIVSGSSDSSARVWSRSRLDCLHVLDGHTDAVNEVVLKVYVKSDIMLSIISTEKCVQYY